MSDRIDAELEKLRKSGQTPKAIHIGHELHLELYDEENPPVAADIVRDGQAASVITPNEVRDYKGIPVVIHEDAAPDYLHIQT